MTSWLDVRPDAFYDSAQQLLHLVCDPVNTALHRVVDTLDGLAAMAGSDPGAAAWALQYDGAVRSTVQGGQDLADAMYRAVGLLEQTGVNHELADTASTPGGLRLEIMRGRKLHDPSFGYRFPAPVSAAGGSTDAPTGWSLIMHLVGHVWPNGHQDRLRAAADAWNACARSLGSAADGVIDAIVPLLDQHTPEVTDAWTTLDAFIEHLRQLACAATQLARTCLGLAEHIDTMRSQVEHELLSLGGQTLLIEGLGAVAAVFSGGAAEAPTQAVELSRVRAVAETVRGIIETFTGLARELAESIPSISEISESITSAVSRLRSVRLRVVEVEGAPGLRTLVIARDERLTTTTMTAEERAEAGLAKAAGERPPLPRLAATRQQIEKKFRHAGVFGVESRKGRDGYEEFERALEDFLDSSATTRVNGTYRGDPAILNYDVATRLVVVQRTDGTFWSGWKLTESQLRSVMEEGALGVN